MATRPVVVQGARLVDAPHWRGEHADVLVVGDSIAEISPHLEIPLDAEIFDATGLLIHPGLVNSHTHGHGSLAKGTGDRWTLELLLAAGSWISGKRAPQDRYLGAALNAAELALKGCTAAYDLFFEIPGPTIEGIEEAVRAYEDVGIRVVMAPMLSDISLYDAVPGLIDALPENLRQTVHKFRAQPWRSSFTVVENLHRGWRRNKDQARLAIAPTIPTHCSEELLVACRQFADQTGLGLHSHVAESKVQLVAGEAKYGSSIVSHLGRIGLLRPSFTVAHGVWLSPDDMRQLADAGSSVAVNPGSNMRLGNGLPDIRGMLHHGINVAVGSDGSNSSDNQNMYEATRLAAYVSRVNGPDPADWLTSQEAFCAATTGGSAALGFGDGLGRLAVGVKADLVFLDLQSINWLPVNQPLNQIVYTEDSRSVRHVMSGGRLIVKDGQLTTCDLSKLSSLASETRQRLDHDTASLKDLFEQVRPYVAAHCPGLASRPHSVQRYCSPPAHR